jgi:PAS domain-containing protein
MRSDGQPIVVSLTISPILDEKGDVVGASKIVRDVTRQRQAEERERKLLADAASANAKFRAFFEQGALFAGIMDVDGTLLDANRLSWEGCGFTREEARRPERSGTGHGGRRRRRWSSAFASPRRAAAGEPFRAEVPYFVGDGSQRIADVSIQPIGDGRGTYPVPRARPAATSPSASASRTTCASSRATFPTPTAARTSSSRRSRTSCATRSRRSPTCSRW